MKKLAIAGLLALGALLGTFLLSNSASAYPDVQISMRSDHEFVRSGDTFTVSAVSNVNCAWELSWNHDSRASSDADFTTEFVAPEVSSTTKMPLTGACTYVKAGSARAAASTPQRLTITVLPPAGGATSTNQDSASLASTGGPDRVVLLSGVILLFAGATVAMVARRRAEDAELPGRTV